MLFLDTSGLLCYVSQREPQHQQAVQLLNGSQRNLIHNLVLTEFVALASVRGFPRREALEFVCDLLDNSNIEVVWADEILNKNAIELLKKRPDKNYSLCDAVSFVLMKQRGLREALTTDKHFEQEGFVKLLQS